MDQPPQVKTPKDIFMKAIRYFFLFSLLFVSAKQTNVVEIASPPISKWTPKKVIFDIVHVRNGRTEAEADRISDVVMEFSDSKKLCWKLITAQGWVESHFDRKAESEVGAQGIWQLMTNSWTHLLWYIDNGDLGRYLNKNPHIKDYKRYFQRIRYNAEMNSMIWEYLLDLTENNTNLALVGYGYKWKVFEKARRYNNPEKYRYVKKVNAKIKFIETNYLGVEL